MTRLLAQAFGFSIRQDLSGQWWATRHFPKVQVLEVGPRKTEALLLADLEGILRFRGELPKA